MPHHLETHKTKNGRKEEWRTGNAALLVLAKGGVF